MSFAVCHVRKCSASTFGLGQHNDRSNTPPNADEKLSHLNIELISHKHNIETAINNRIKEGYKGKTAIRRDAVKAIEVNLSGSHERMKEIEADPKLFDSWLKTNQEWLEEKYGKANIVSLYCHRDEYTPHIHAVVVPLTSDGRLSAKEILGNRKDFTQLQEEYSKVVADFGLKRGVEGSKAKHTDVKEYSKTLNAELPKVQEELKEKIFDLQDVQEALKHAKTESEAKKLILEAYNRDKSLYDAFELNWLKNVKKEPLIEKIKDLSNDLHTQRTTNEVLINEVKLKGNEINDLRRFSDSIQMELLNLKQNFERINKELVNALEENKTLKLSTAQMVTVQINNFLENKDFGYRFIIGNDGLNVITAQEAQRLKEERARKNREEVEKQRKEAQAKEQAEREKENKLRAPSVEEIKGKDRSPNKGNNNQMKM